MSEVETDQAALTAADVPMTGFTAGAENTDGTGAGEEQEAGGNTVTFGGVETFTATNSTSGSTPGTLTEGMS